MAHAQTHAEVAVAGTKPKTATRSFTRRFWVKVAVIVTVALSPWIPTLWGWQLGFLGTGHGDWSMAAHGGIIPGSLVYHKRLPGYSVGDKISFEYKGNNDPAENGRSLKLIAARNSDGTYHVKGMNYVNSFAPCDVKSEDIYGKVVWSHSFLPETYWRWISLGWTLNTDEINARWHAIFSIRTIGSVFTKTGRFRNWVVLRFPPETKRYGGDYLAFDYLGGIDVVRRNQRKVIVHVSGQFVDWNNGVLVYRHGKSLRLFDPRTEQETTCQCNLNSAKEGEQLELVVRNSEHSILGPTHVLVGKSLSRKAKIRINGVIYSIRIYRQFDYDVVLKKPVSTFNLTPRDDSVPSGTITATVVSR